MEDLSIYQGESFELTIPPQIDDSTKIVPNKATIMEENYSHPEIEIQEQMNALQPLTIDIYSDNTVLSRTLKRKFTELEEITQRLRARLFDVTGDLTIDPDEEFENDLNTNPDEEDNEYGENMVSWLNSASAATQQYHNSKFAGQANEYQHNMAILSISSSDFIKPNAISDINTIKLAEPQYLKSFEMNDNNFDAILNDDIDTIVNSNKSHNPLQETNNDKSKPQLMMQSSAVPLLTNPTECIDSSVKYSSLLFEQDRIRIISNALEKAVLTDLPPEKIAASDSVRGTQERDGRSASSNLDSTQKFE